MTAPDPSSRVGSSDAASWGAFFTCVLVWGSTFLVIAFGNDEVPPLWGATIRLVLAATILFTVMAIRRIPFPRGAGLRAAMLYGFFTLGLNMSLLYLGELTVPSGLAAVIYSTVPLSQALVARLVGLERLTPSKIVGAIVAVLGVALIFSRQLTGEASPLGMIWILVATWAACFGAVSLKRGPRQSAIASNAVGSVVGMVIALSGSFLLRETHPIPSSAPALLPILYLAVAGSVVAFVTYTWLLNRWDATRASYVGVMTPVVALVLGAFARHERVGAPALAGAAIVILGVVIGLGLLRPRGA